jgi:hypothetical protein
MADTCENVLFVVPASPEANDQLQDFIEKSTSSEFPFCLEGTLSMPEELNDTPNTYENNGIAILMAQRGDNRLLTKILAYPWVKQENITTEDDLARYILAHDEADLGLAAILLDNLEKYGAMNEYDWTMKNWGCHCVWDGSLPAKVLESTNSFRVEFYTPNYPPERWLEKVAPNYPDLIFYLRYESFAQFEGFSISYKGKTVSGDPLTGEFLHNFN